MTFTDAAREVLRQSGRPLHYKEITELAIEKNLLSHVGKSPEVTMGARLAATLKKEGDTNPLVRVKPGVFALREWDDAVIKQGLDIKRTAKRKSDDDDDLDGDDDNGVDDLRTDDVAEDVRDDDADDDVAAARADDDVAEAPGGDDDDAEVRVDARAHAPVDDDDDDDEIIVTGAGQRDVDGDDDEPIAVLDDDAPRSPRRRSRRGGGRGRSSGSNGQVTGQVRGGRPERVAIDSDLPPAPDETMRAERAAGAAKVFAEEEDDDQPILRRDDEPASEPDGRRRRRRRRRRGSRGPGETEQVQQSASLPSYTATPVYEGGEPAPRGPQVIELAQEDLPALDGLAGRDLADAVAMILGSFDRTVGAVSLRQIADTAQRRGKLAGETQLAQSQIAAAVRADNARRQSHGYRPRFRMAGGRVGLTDWLLDHDLARFEREALVALGRYRDAARRALARKISELPGHAFVELSLLLLERLGLSGIKPVKFPGASGAEVHFSAVLHTPAAALDAPVGVGDGLRLAVIIRKDGRDLGRERVSEIRGTSHHYEHARMGWILSGGQVLSGAREEASATGVMPVSLLDAAAIARLCEDHEVGVLRASHPVAIPDVDLFEALRAT